MASPGAFLGLLAGALVAMAPAALASAAKKDELCPLWQSTDITHAVFFSNGSVEDVDAGELYPLGAHWATTVNGTSRLLGCPCQLGRPCLRKCCAWDQQMDNETLECVAHGGPRDWFRPRVMVDSDGDSREIERGQFGVANGNYCFGYLLEPHVYKEDKFYINISDGTLHIPESKKFGLDTSSYCLEYVNNIDLYLPYVCFAQLGLTDSEDICDTLRYSIYPLGMAVSIIFLVISLVIYATTAELRNLHGKCLMCHMASLLVGYLFLVIVQSAGGMLDDNACTAFGFVIYFALLCSFFWLNIMCIDIYVAFSSFTPPRMHSSDLKKFLTYILYAWGLPFVIILVTAVMEFHPEVKSGYYLRPEFKATCWFYTRSSRLAYFIAPVGVLVICNVILFALTAFNIYKVNRETSILQRGSSSKSREDKNRLKLYIKLSIVMGVSWILEIVSYVAGGSKCIWLFTDTLNTLQGFFIFLIFVCKRNVKEIMRKRFRKLTAKVSSSLARDSGEPGRDDVETSRSADTASSSLPSVEMAEKCRP